MASDWKKLKPHRLADELPQMSEEEYQALKQDIRLNGLKEPILLYEGQILDGRHRHRACMELDVEVDRRKLQTFQGTQQEARRRVASANLMRRHLSKSQKAMYAVLAGLVAPPAAKGRRRKYGTGRNSIMELGRQYGVNHVTLYKAAYVASQDRKVAQQVMDGTLSVARAEAVVNRTATGQDSHPSLLDGAGKPLPQSLAKVFATRPQFEAIVSHLEKSLGLLETIAEQGIPPERLKPLRASLAAAQEALKQATPHHACPKCRGKGCAACTSLGWLPDTS